ncbi:MAG: hypothetical protein U1E53_22485 [Dongiaceae bacterium]
MGADYPPAPLARLYDAAAAHLGPVFAGWPWLAGAAGLLGWSMWRGGRRGAIAAALACSALLGIAGLALVAADAATRYLFWPILATLLGLVVAAGPDHGRSHAAGGGGRTSR